MPEAAPTGAQLLAVSREFQLLCQPLFFMKTVPTSHGIGPVLEHLQAHLEYWVRLEQERVLFAAGPVMPADASDPWSGEGIVILRADSLEAARAIADADPMHVAGARTYDLRPWLLNHLQAG